MTRAVAIALTIAAATVITLVLIYALEDGRCEPTQHPDLIPSGWRCVENP